MSCCNKDTLCHRLKHSKKESFMFYRRFLEPTHHYHRDKKFFDNTQEWRAKPKMLSGHDILEQFEGYKNITFGKPITTVDGGTRKRKRDEIEENKSLPYAWKKISIFFRLPYWKSLLARHNLDVMHIEKKCM